MKKQQKSNYNLGFIISFFNEKLGVLLIAVGIFMFCCFATILLTRK